MDANLETDLDEAKATGENSVAADPVTGAGGAVKKRKGDLFKAPGPVQAGTPVVTPQGTNNAGLHEVLSSVFGEEISEDFKNKAETLWEAAMHERVEAIRAELSEEFDTKLTEEVEAAVEEITEKLDAYLDYVVENWMEENTVAIETGYKVNVAESILAGIKALVEDHNLDIQEEELNAVAAMESELEESNNKYNEVVEELLALREQKATLEREVAFNGLSEGMVATDAARFKTLSEGVSFEGINDYKKKLETIKESYFAESVARAEDQAEFLEEAVEDVQKVAMSPSVAAYVESLNKIAQN